MDHWEEDTLNSLMGVKKEQPVFEAVARAAKLLGFDYCAYGAKTPIPVSSPKIVLFNNYTSAWREQYAINNYIAVDPTVQHAFRSPNPIIWTPCRFSQASAMWENAHAHGLRHGWAQSSRDRTGLVGLLTLARSEDHINESELRENQSKMTWLAQVAHNAMSGILTPTMLPEAGMYITDREREVLLWTAEGKTAYEVSIILSISVGTVNFHINNFVAKLGACNKIQAVVKAAMCGLLS